VFVGSTALNWLIPSKANENFSISYTLGVGLMLKRMIFRKGTGFSAQSMPYHHKRNVLPNVHKVLFISRKGAKTQSSEPYNIAKQ
jgi:hypothetical protein